MYILESIKKEVHISKLSNYESKSFPYKSTGQIWYPKAISIEDKELFYDVDSKNKYIPNTIAKKFNIIPDPSGGMFSLVFDYSKKSDLIKFLKKNNYLVKEVESEYISYIRDQVQILVDHYNKTKNKNDENWFLKNLKNLYKASEITDEEIKEYNLIDYRGK